MALSGAVSTVQLAGWIDMPAITMPSGLFTNRIPMGEAAALAIIWLIAERMWWWALLPLPAYVLSDARGATLALAVGLGVVLWQRPSWLIGGLLLANLALLAHGVSTHTTATMLERGAIWAAETAGCAYRCSATVSGPLAALRTRCSSTTRHPSTLHNDALELLWETGIIGFLPSTDLHATTVRAVECVAAGSDRVRSGGVLWISGLSSRHPLSRWGGCRPCCSGSGCGTRARSQPARFWLSVAPASQITTRLQYR